jgi:hypothetical protein
VIRSSGLFFLITFWLRFFSVVRSALDSAYFYSLRLIPTALLRQVDF